MRINGPALDIETNMAERTPKAGCLRRRILYEWVPTRLWFGSMFQARKCSVVSISLLVVTGEDDTATVGARETPRRAWNDEDCTCYGASRL